MFKVNNENIRIMCKICSKLTINLYIVDFEKILHIVMVFQLSTLYKKCLLGRLQLTDPSRKMIFIYDFCYSQKLDFF